MCRTCLNAFFHSYMQLFNIIHSLAGLSIIGFGVYMIVKAPADISYGIVALGGVVFLAGIIGWFGVGHKDRCLLKIYDVLMALLCLVQATLCILLVANKELVIGNIPTSDNDKYNEIKDWIEDNITIFIFIEAALAGAELLLVIFSCCYSGGFKKTQRYNSMDGPMIEEVPYQPMSYERTERQKKNDAIRAKYNLPTRV